MVNSIPDMPDWLQTVVFPLNRWLHIVATALLVGGTLFYEFVLPRAIEDLREEVQLSIMGRVRWVFFRIVAMSTAALVVTGAVAGWRLLPIYRDPVFRVVPPWVWAHVGLGVIAMAVGLRVVNRTRVPRHPLTWLRVNFVVMLIVLFIAAVARHLRVTIQDGVERDHAELFQGPPSESR